MSKLPLHDDGELPFEDDSEKPKKRPPARLWRKTYIPIPLLLAACLLLICSAVLLLATSLFNGSLLCKISSLCSPPTETWIPPIIITNDPRPPLDEVRIHGVDSYNDFTHTASHYVTTATPSHYTAPHCDPDADYRNHLMFRMGDGDNSEIFVMAPDGTSLCRVTNNLIEEMMIDWSPDRAHILFSSQRSGDIYSDLYVMDFDGTHIVNLTRDTAIDGGGVWSPDGTRIAFSSDRNPFNEQIFIMNADGSDPYDVTPDALNAQTPSWSPDGTQIAYMAGSDNDPNKFHIYVVDVNSKISRRLTTDVVDEFSPAWSPQGSMLLVELNTVSDVGIYTGPDIFMLDSNQINALRRLTHSQDSIRPTWSPDGTQIAYVSNHGVRVLDLASGTDRVLAGGYDVRDRPVWR